MSDPFDTGASNRQLVREARVGLTIVGLMILFFVYVGYYRIDQFSKQIPDHVLSAPVARQVGPDFHSRALGQVAEVDHRDPWHSNPNGELTESTTAKRMPTATRDIAEQPIRDPELRKASTTQTVNQLDSEQAIPGNSPKRTDQADSLVKTGQRLVNDFEKSSRQLVNALVPIQNRPQTNTTSTSEPSFDGKIQHSPRNTRSSLQPKILTANRPPDLQVPQNEFDIARPFATNPNKRIPNSNSKAPNWLNEPNGLRSSQANAPESNEALNEPFVAGPKVPTSNSIDRPSSFDQQTRLAPQVVSKVEQSTNQISNRSQTVQQTNHLETTKTEIPKALSGLQPGPSSNRTNGRLHKIVFGDSYWSIAQARYGDGRLFRALFMANKPVLKRFENLEPGTVIEIPELETLVQRFPNECPREVIERFGMVESIAADSELGYTTREGDTLFEIARQHLGQASRYLEILDENRASLPDNVHHLTSLPAGIKLGLPD